MVVAGLQRDRQAVDLFQQALFVAVLQHQQLGMSLTRPLVGGGGQNLASSANRGGTNGWIDDGRAQPSLRCR